MLRVTTTPAYRQIGEFIAGQIRDGVWEPGDRLPSINQVATERGVNREVARKALDWLVEQGWAVVQQGVGYEVAAVPPAPPEPVEDWRQWRERVEERLGRLENPPAG